MFMRNYTNYTQQINSRNYFNSLASPFHLRSSPNLWGITSLPRDNSLAPPYPPPVKTYCARNGPIPDMKLTNDTYLISIGTKNFTERYFRDQDGWLKISARGRKFRMTARKGPRSRGIRSNDFGGRHSQSASVHRRICGG